MFINKKRLLVYKLASLINEKSIALPKGIEWAHATKDNITHLFRKDRRRKKTFLRFIDKGYYGIIIYYGTQWVNYGWMSTPDTFGPPHLPLDTQQKQVYWLFYAHTLPSFRGRNLHKYGMWLRILYAFNQTQNPEIYTDTTADNIASRKGILSVKFEPAGIINTRTLKIPRIKSWTWGSWDIDAEHPVIDGGNNS